METLQEFILKYINESDSNDTTGSWHGNNAHILNDDGDGYTILIGDYTDEEIRKVAKLVENEEDLGDYKDWVKYVSYEEWESQQ